MAPPSVTGDLAIEVRTLHSAVELDDCRLVCDAVWPGEGTTVTPNLLRACVHAGGYAAAAYVEGRPVGAAMGIVGRHRTDAGWESHLHSHMNAVLPRWRDQGIGAALKRHQGAWALDQGLRWVTWTFDPLVRRNAHLNVTVLGAQVRGYEPDFYGSMDDGINSGDPTDRVFAWWDPRIAEPASPVVPADGDRVIAVPDDIVALRATDPAAALEWRLRVRDAMTGALADGLVVLGLDASSAYVMGVPRDPGSGT